jgi:hypothetical protein
VKNVLSLVSGVGDRLLELLVPDAGIAEAAAAPLQSCPTQCWCERYEDGSAIKCRTWENNRCVIKTRCLFCC